MWFFCAFLNAPWVVFKMASASKSQTSCVEKKSRLKLNTQKNQKKKGKRKKLTKKLQYIQVATNVMMQL